MNTLSKKNERKHKINGVLYTALLLGLLFGMFAFSGQASGLKDRIMEMVNPEEKVTTEQTAPVAMLLDHRGGNG